MASIRVDPPPLRDPVLSRETIQFLHQLWRRTSDPTGNAIDDIQTSIDEQLLQQIEANTAAAAEAQSTADGALQASQLQLLKVEPIGTLRWYRGEAVPDTAEDATGWRIHILDLNDGVEDSRLYANGSLAADKTWAGRAGYVY